VPCTVVVHADGKRLGRETCGVTYRQPRVLVTKGDPMTHEEFARMSNLAGRGESDPSKKSRDQDQGKGAVEQDQDNQGGNTSMSGQLGHRDENAELKNADSDLSG
jgi:hypothetical protein